jgi:cob(I)alamin adenosyltransferase
MTGILVRIRGGVRVVRLSKIYTKVGDGGKTALGDGAMVPKHDARVEAYGSVDEGNAALGIVVTVLDRSPGDALLAGMRRLIVGIQNDLFDVGADLCVPREASEKPGARLRITQAQIDALERAIDVHNDRLKPLNSFVLPGGTVLAAHLHVARTVVRRAERRTSTLLADQPKSTNPLTLIYLNRLSDLVFVLARVANNDGAGDVLWVPGAGRGT